MTNPVLDLTVALRNQRLVDAMPDQDPHADVREFATIRDRQQYNERIAQLVLASGSVVRPGKFGGVVVIDGRTGKDAWGETAEDAFTTLFAEQDATQGDGSR